jgi:hypothetical protein
MVIQVVSELDCAIPAYAGSFLHTPTDTDVLPTHWCDPYMGFGRLMDLI